MAFQGSPSAAHDPRSNRFLVEFKIICLLSAARAFPVIHLKYLGVGLSTGKFKHL